MPDETTPAAAVAVAVAADFAAPVPDRAGSVAMAIGLAAFGLALGAIAGLAVSPVAQTLLTSLFTFVGGVLLTFAGFTVEDRRSDGNVRTRIDTFRTGLGLAGFSLGLIAGVVAGIYVRVLHPGVVVAPADAKPAAAAQAPAPAHDKPAAAGSAFGLQGLSADACADIKRELDGGQYGGNDALAVQRVRQLLKAAQCPGSQ
jgi:hypothetical protein